MLFLGYQNSKSQTVYTKEKNGFALELKKEIACTAIKNQGSSSTCWSFSTQSFLESELNRMGKGQVDLSEMYVIRMIYFEKAVSYIRRMGETSFGPGGEHSDVLYCIKKYGIVPQDVYSGNVINNKPNHHEIDQVLESFVKSITKMKDEPLSPYWRDALNGILDAYFGKVPTQFTYNEKNYSPLSFANYLDIQPDNYLLFTSFNHHPYYEKFVLEIPDNWINESYFNIPLDVLEQTIDDAINAGYSVAWSADITEKGFSFKNGIAIIPEKKWEDIDYKERETIFLTPIKQKEITQEIRQEAFDNLSTQDDHAMHIVGIAYDNLGQKYYKIKNSWGVNSNEIGGFFYASASYVRFKTTSICLHKDGVSKNLLNKMNK